MKIYRELPLSVNVTYYRPASPGRTYGPPEDCYPPEDAEIEFVLTTPGGHTLDASDFPIASDWQDLVTEVFETFEGAIEDARADAQVDAYLDRMEDL